jgi:hypothetical protein
LPDPSRPVAALQLSLALYPLAAPAQNLRLASAACTPARPVANLPARIGFVSSARPGRTSDSHRLFRASCRPEAIHQACAWRSSFHPACAAWPFLRLGRRPTSDSHRTPSFGSTGGCIRLAPHVPQLPRLASASGLHRLLSPLGFTGRRPLGLRLAISSPVEPLMHSLFRPNLASPAEPSMSIQFSTGLCIFRNHPAELLPTCVGSCNFWCVQRSLCSLRRRFHPLSGLAAIAPALTGCSLR